MCVIEKPINKFECNALLLNVADQCNESNKHIRRGRKT